MDHPRLVLISQTTSMLKHPCRLCLRNGRPVFCVLALLLRARRGLKQRVFIFVWTWRRMCTWEGRLSLRSCYPFRSLRVLRLTWKLTLPTALKDSDHALLRSPPSPSLMLRSNWSSSTIGSVRDEDERRSPSTKLRSDFGGGGKRGSKNSKALKRRRRRAPLPPR